MASFTVLFSGPSYESLLALSGEEASFSIEGFYKGFIKLCVVVEGLENTPYKIPQSMDLMVEFLVELLRFLFEQLAMKLVELRLSI